MSKKAKYTDTELMKGIEQGLEDGSIMDKLSIPLGSRGGIKKRLEKLREKHGATEVHIPGAGEPKEFSKEFDLKRYDTVTRLGKWYRVVTMGEDSFVVAETANREKREVVMKEDYISGQSGFIKRDFPEVKTYTDESLKRKPATINKEFEEAVNAMVRENAVKKMDDDVNPAYSFDAPASNFILQAELSFKSDIGRYTSYASKLSEKMAHGEIIDLADVTEYNKVVGKYSGGAV